MYSVKPESRIKQGDILNNLEFKYVGNTDNKVTSIPFDYWVILSQDCDLEWDFEHREEDSPKSQDKFLQTILVCPAFVADQFKAGSHMSQQGLTMNKWEPDLWKGITRNNNYRIHYLEAGTDSKFPALIIDFKRFFTVPREYLYQLLPTNYVISIDELFREALSQRFAYYLSRIALPEESKS